MSLTNAINSSLTALNVVQESIGVAANNIANVDTPGYIKQKVNQVPLLAAGVGQGVEIAGISANVDNQLLVSLQDQISDLGMAESLETFFNSVQTAFGTPDSGNSLSARLDDFFNAFQTLSGNPDNVSLRVSALTDIKELASSFSGIATKLQDLRLDVDRKIHTDVIATNSLLDSLANSNSEIISHAEGSSGRLGVEQQRTLDLQKLSEYIDISTIVDGDGSLAVLTKSGTSLLDSTGVYHIQHTQAASANNFIDDASLTAIKVARVEQDGSLSTNTIDLATSGKSSTVTTSLESGTLKGLLDLRDTEIPKVLEQLDTLAASLIREANTIHNDGGSFPPASSLTGSRSITSNLELGFSGKVMIAVLDSDGTPPTSPYTDETNYRPLTLDLATLDGGNGAGRPTVQTIVDEINYYYGPVQNRASVGNLRNIALAVSPDTDSIANQGTVKFDLELDNISTENASVVVNSVVVSGGGYPAASVTGGFPTTAYVVNPGDRERTNVPITVDFGAPGADLATYTVQVNVTVTDVSGNISTATIDYYISDNITSGLRNDRYDAEAVTSVTGTSSFIAAPSNKSYAQASIVDADGNAVSAGESGVLKITTTTGSNFGLVFDEMDSEEIGLPSSLSTDVTNKGFAHYFEMNNLFVSNSDTVAGSAINMAVRTDIAANASLIAAGKLALSNQPDDSTQALYTYEVASGSNGAATAMSDLRNAPVAFAATSTLPAVTTTFTSYTADVIGFVATTSYNFTNNAVSEKSGLDGLQGLLQESSGVTTDEELARIVELENNYRASARIITVIQELFKVLSQSLA